MSEADTPRPRGPAAQNRGGADARTPQDGIFRRLFEASSAAFLVLAPNAPRYTIVGVNDAYLAATMRTRKDLVGSALFEAFPENPDDVDGSGVSSLRASLDEALRTRRPQVMQTLKYDIPQTGTGFADAGGNRSTRPCWTSAARWWRSCTTPPT